MQNNTKNISVNRNLVSPVTKNSPSKLVDKFFVSDIIRLYNEIYDVDVTRFFKGVEYIELYECEKTKYRFYYPFTIAGDAPFYEDLQREHEKRGITYYRGWAFDHQFAYDNIGPDQSVLDIGCGSGNFLEKAREKTLSIYGLEFNDMAIQACSKKGIQVSKKSIEEYATSAAEEYDVVCAFQVLEHISDVKSFLDGAIQVLKPGGKLILGVPNSDPYFVSYSKYDTLNLPPHHMGLWNKNVFINLQCAFPLTYLETVYQEPARILVDAYYRSKYLWNIRSSIHRHSFIEKLKMAAAAPLTLGASFMISLKKGKPRAHLVVSFRKTDNP